MAWWNRSAVETPRKEPVIRAMAMASAQSEFTISTAAQLEEALKTGFVSDSGEAVTPDRALRVASVFRCISLRAGTVANMPFDVKRRVDDRVREDASDHPLWTVLKRRPNRWQKPAQFKRMMQSSVLMRGNAYALKIFNLKKQVTELIPLQSDRMTVKQDDNQVLTFTYTLRGGGQVVFQQAEILHLYCLTLNGFTGVTPLTYARETIGGALAMESHGNTVFRNGARVSGQLIHPGSLGQEATANLRASMDQFKKGGDKESSTLILEEGMEYKPMAMNSDDAQWIQARGMTNSDIYRFFGIPPFLAGDTEKSTSWGTGLEEQKNGYVTFTAEDDLIMWEEGCTVDLLDDPKLYVRANRASLVRGNIKDRTAAHVAAVQWGAISPNEWRSDEDMNPRPEGDVFYSPPNTAGNAKTNGANDAQTP